MLVWRKKRKRFPSYLSSIILATFLFTTGLFSLTPHACAGFSTLKKAIIAYNLEHREKSLSDGSYRGEEGILRINPEVARSFGLNVLMDQDYSEAKALYREAGKLFGKVLEAMAKRKKERFPGEHVKNVGELAILYNKTLRLAREHMKAYRSNLDRKIDERLDKRVCSDLLEELLQKSITRTSFNLRDALGYFYNLCQDLDNGEAPLNSKNVKFVNYVMQQFTVQAPESAVSQFDLDRCQNSDVAGLDSGWKRSLGMGGSRYVAFVEPVFEEYERAGYSMDLFLFLALIRQESNFNPRDVSSVGAVGLTQIMPKTAKELGMQNVYMPPYFEKAGSLMERERKLRHRAKSFILKIDDRNKLEFAGRARELMQESLTCRRERTKLFSQYKQEILKQGTDDRLDPHKAIKYGYKYFARMMTKQKGDISLALASYNAGPHRVKQYNGIPPYAETVNFRNKVLKYYREYLERIKKYRESNVE